MRNLHEERQRTTAHEKNKAAQQLVKRTTQQRQGTKNISLGNCYCSEGFHILKPVPSI
jgi:hypothetical protein